MATATVTLEGNNKVVVPANIGTKILAAQMGGQSEVDCTQDELIGLLSSISRKGYNQFVGVTTDTEPRLRGGKSNPLAGLRKVSTYVVRFHEWQDAVENQMKRDGIDNPKYTPSYRPTGKEYVGDSPVLVGNTKNTKGTYYLAIIPVRGSRPVTTFYHPSQHIDQQTAKESEYRPPNAHTKQHDAGVQNGLDYRSVKIENIVSIKLGGFIFRVTS